MAAADDDDIKIMVPQPVISRDGRGSGHGRQITR
jgi:hypothetical protein